MLAKIIQSTFFIIWYVMKQNVFWEKYVISSRLGLNQLSFNSAILLLQSSNIVKRFCKQKNPWEYACYEARKVYYTKFITGLVKWQLLIRLEEGGRGLSTITFLVFVGRGQIFYYMLSHLEYSNKMLPWLPDYSLKKNLATVKFKNFRTKFHEGRTNPILSISSWHYIKLKLTPVVHIDKIRLTDNVITSITWLLLGNNVCLYITNTCLI